MEKILSFLSELIANNNKPWFDSHKSVYLEAQTVFNDFVRQLLSGIGEFDSSVNNLEVKDCIYRIYRDTRFSKDKTPYKTHIGAFIAPGGKGGGHAGYYFHIEPKGAGYIGGHLLSAGIYMPDSKALKSIREEIMLNGDIFLDSIKSAKGFKIDTDRALKRIPLGFSQDPDYSEYYKLRDFFVTKKFDDQFLNDDNLLENTLSEFKKTVAFITILNKAIDYKP